MWSTNLKFNALDFENLWIGCIFELAKNELFHWKHSECFWASLSDWFRSYKYRMTEKIFIQFQINLQHSNLPVVAVHKCSTE